MSKQSDPWDDSPLVNALDDAIKNYKKMHKIERCDNPKEVETVVEISSTEAVSTATPDVLPEQVLETIESWKDTEKADDPSIIKETHQTDLHTQEPTTHTSNGADMQQEVPDEHNELLKQYYELEEQRQKVLQQLQQSGYWNSPYSGEVSGYQDFNQQISHTTIASSCCCPCVCPMAPCSAMPASSSISKKDFEPTSIVKTAMGAAERAISSINISVSGDHTKHQGSLEGQMGDDITPETDLTVVLNAWYSAGFYTGRYLSEQSSLKSKP